MRSVLAHLPLLRERVPHTVGLAAELDEPPVVDDPVDHGRRHLVVAEHRAPPADLQVRGDGHRLPLVGVGEHLEERPRAVGVQRREAEFVDDEQPRAADERGLPVGAPLVAGAPEAHDERRRGEESGLHPPLARHHARRRGHVRLAGAGVPHRHEVLAALEEPERCQVLAPEPLVPRDRRPVVPVAVFGAGSAQRRSSVARLEASPLARSASRWPARYSTRLGVPSSDHSSSTAVVSERVLPASTTLRARPPLAVIADRPLQEPAAGRQVGGDALPGVGCGAPGRHVDGRVAGRPPALDDPLRREAGRLEPGGGAGPADRPEGLPAARAVRPIDARDECPGHVAPDRRLAEGPRPGHERRQRGHRVAHRRALSEGVGRHRGPAAAAGEGLDDGGPHAHQKLPAAPMSARRVLAPVDPRVAALVRLRARPPHGVEGDPGRSEHPREVLPRRLRRGQAVAARRGRARAGAPVGEHRVQIGHRPDRRDGDEQVASQEPRSVLHRALFVTGVRVAEPRLEAAMPPLNCENSLDSTTVPCRRPPASVVLSRIIALGVRPQRPKTSRAPRTGAPTSARRAAARSSAAA